VSTQNTLEAQATINLLERSIRTDTPQQKQDLEKQLVALRTSIGDAVHGIAATVQAGLCILTIQGKTVRELFENANLPVPEGF
jgi:hypothetical protein